MPSQRGFNLIELMISMALLALLMSLAVPLLSSSSQNGKIRATADSLLSSLQNARTEAIRRNAEVELIFTNDPATEAAVNTASPRASGRNWIVRMTPQVGSSVYTFIEGRSAAEGSGQSDGSTPVVMVPTMSDGTGFNTIKFTNLGSITFNTGTTGIGGQIDVANPSGGACTSASTTTAMRCLRVLISVSGQVRVCDPAVTELTDPRRCS
jgi:type IV fimbrial biogenesis protein FimT